MIRYLPDEKKMGTGTVSQCFSCKAKSCNRNKFKKNNVGGLVEAPSNPGVVLSKGVCKYYKPE